MTLGRALIAGLSLTLAFGCSASSDDPPAEGGGDVGADPPADVVSTDWVRIYDPIRAASGYTLDLFWGRVPTLVDMNGRIVHSWPEARVRSRVRLQPDGSLLGLSLGRSVVRYDWAGHLVWEYDAGERLPHHDVRELANGNVLVPVLARERRSDDLLEIDPEGRVVWEWRSDVHLAHLFTPEVERTGDRTHINSIQELPENPWYRAGDERFRPGNLLVSARSLNTALIIDRSSKEVVWVYDRDLDRQHEALMIEPGLPGEGNVLLFDNGYGSLHRYRASRVLQIRPTDNEIVWSYEAEGFYSPTVGLAQPLPNGNTLVASSRGGRTFEVTPEGEIVWQWAPPFEPVRPARYAYDATPQLALLDAPLEERVAAPPEYRHIDPRTHEFARQGALREAVLERRPETVLAANNTCRRVLLPSQPRLRVTYGVSLPRLREAGRDRFEARFRILARRDGGTEESLLFEDRVGVEAPRWREQHLDLDAHALQWIDLCLRTEEIGAPAGTPTEAFAFWSNPQIFQADATTSAPPPEERPLADDELEAQREHLRTLGYVQ